MSNFKIIARDKENNSTLIQGPMHYYFFVPTKDEADEQFLEYAWSECESVPVEKLLSILVNRGLLKCPGHITLSIPQFVEEYEENPYEHVGEYDPTFEED